MNSGNRGDKVEYISLLSNVAEVECQLNPDDRYCRDDDGYGMTDDEEIAVYGFIDAAVNVLVKFQYIGDNREHLKEMRCDAERKLLRKRKD